MDRYNLNLVHGNLILLPNFVPCVDGSPQNLSWTEWHSGVVFVPSKGTDNSEKTLLIHMEQHKNSFEKNLSFNNSVRHCNPFPNSLHVL